MPTCPVCNHSVSGTLATCPACGTRRSSNPAATTITAATLLLGFGGVACTGDETDDSMTSLDTDDEVSADEYAGPDGESPFETETGDSTSETGESSESESGESESTDETGDATETG